MSEKDFKEFLDLNKIIYTKAERLTSKKDGRVLKMFNLEIKDEAAAEALISQNLTCRITGIIYKVEEFLSPISVQQCWNCQNFGNSAKTCKSKTKCLICGESLACSPVHTFKRTPLCSTHNESNYLNGDFFIPIKFRWGVTKFHWGVLKFFVGEGPKNYVIRTNGVSVGPMT